MTNAAEFRVVADINDFQRKMGEVNRTLDVTARKAAASTTAGGTGGGSAGVSRAGMIAGIAAVGVVNAAMSSIAAGIREVAKEQAAGARLNFALARTGLVGQKDAINKAVESLQKDTGKAGFEIKDLIAQQINTGVSDLAGSMGIMKLAIDQEAAGRGSAARFLDMFNKAASGSTREMEAYAKEMGIANTNGMSLGTLLMELQKRFGGLSEEVKKAEGGWGQFSESLQNMNKANAEVWKWFTDTPARRAAEIGQSVASGDIAMADTATNFGERRQNSLLLKGRELRAEVQSALAKGSISEDEAVKRRGLIQAAIKADDGYTLNRFGTGGFTEETNFNNIKGANQKLGRQKGSSSIAIQIATKADNKVASIHRSDGR